MNCKELIKELTKLTKQGYGEYPVIYIQGFFENDKAHYDVCLYNKVIGYYEELELHYILEENEENLGTLALSGE